MTNGSLSTSTNGGTGPGDGDIDLSTCEREPIHVPGAIQPHGLLFALTEPDLRIVQASANTAALIGREAGALLGTSFEELIDGTLCEQLRETPEGPEMARLSPVPVLVDGRAFDAIVHRADGLAIVELEPHPDDAPAYRDCHAAVRDALLRLQGCADMRRMFEVAVEEVYRIAGFDRVMLYRFHEDQHGEVVAEHCPPGRLSYLHQHYPASDIPSQARRLFELNRLRLIVDAGYVPAPLVPTDNPLRGAPLDLSRSVLRSVSPVHVMYLHNMGVAASMTISLLREQRLWGMIACHHEAPRFVPEAVFGDRGERFSGGLFNQLFDYL